MELEELKKLSDNVENSIDIMAKKQVCGTDLDSANPSHLEVTDENMDEAVSMQPMAISYFTACLSSAKRNLERINFEYSLWRKEKHLQIKFSSTAKLTANDLEAKIDVDNKTELLEWKKKLEEAQQFFDNSESIYEGWKQKGFALNQHAKLRNQDYISTSGGNIAGVGAFPNDFNSSARRVKQFMRKEEPAKEDN